MRIKATDETSYSLSKMKITRLNRSARNTYLYVQWAWRSKIRVIFKANLPSGPTHYFLDDSICHTYFSIDIKKRILTLGCKTFKGASYTALRKWALQKA